MGPLLGTPCQRVLTATLESFSPLGEKREDGIVGPIDLDDTCSQNHLGGFSVRMNGMQRSEGKKKPHLINIIAISLQPHI